jgi:CPA2 family monovalent cation:H+ antiporter-2
LFEMLVIVVASFAAVALLSRRRYSPIVGYLAVGLLIGPHGLNLLPATQGVRFLGELGVAFLMFVVGLEFSLPRMIAARGVVFGMGGLQVVTTTLFAAAVAWAFGVGWLAGLVLGGALAMSSTAIAAKQLADQGELNTQHGRLALGVLLFQDLATLPFLVLVDALSGRAGESVTAAGLRAAVAVALFLAVALPVRRPLSSFMAWVARARSAELFLLAALVLVLGAAALAHEAGLSLPIGAFLAGMVAGESDFRHQLEDEIRPFRDLLLGLFFITVGMAVDPRAITAHPLLVPAAVAALVTVKVLIVLAVAQALRWSAEPALRAGLVLAHGGEFALLIVTQALGAGLLAADAAQLVLVSVAISMALAPALIQHNGPLAARFGAVSSRGPVRLGGDGQEAERAVAAASEPLSGHVILCGCGGAGRLVATVLEASGVAYIAIERDVERLRLAQDQGHRVMFGDATRRGILEAAGLKRAGAVVSTLPVDAAERLVRHVRHDAPPDLPVIVSTDDDTGLGALVEAGATRVLPENLAAGLGLAAQTLAALGLDPRDVDTRMGAVRAALNPELRDLPAMVSTPQGEDTVRVVGHRASVGSSLSARDR